MTCSFLVLKTSGLNIKEQMTQDHLLIAFILELMS